MHDHCFLLKRKTSVHLLHHTHTHTQTQTTMSIHPKSLLFIFFLVLFLSFSPFLYFSWSFLTCHVSIFLTPTMHGGTWALLVCRCLSWGVAVDVAVAVESSFASRCDDSSAGACEGDGGREGRSPFECEKSDFCYIFVMGLMHVCFVVLCYCRSSHIALHCSPALVWSVYMRLRLRSRCEIKM